MVMIVYFKFDALILCLCSIIFAGRNYLNTGNLEGKVFVTSGLGGMSGAQAKAAVIAGCVGVIAEVGLLLEWVYTGRSMC